MENPTKRLNTTFPEYLGVRWKILEVVAMVSACLAFYVPEELRARLVKLQKRDGSLHFSETARRALRLGIEKMEAAHA